MRVLRPVAGAMLQLVRIPLEQQATSSNAISMCNYNENVGQLDDSGVSLTLICIQLTKVMGILVL